MPPITTVSPQMPGAVPTDLGQAESDWSLTSGGGVAHDGARKIPARFAAEIRAMAAFYGVTTDTVASSTHQGRLLALEAGGGKARTENMSAVPAFADLCVTYPDAVTTDHTMGLSVASGKLRITPTGADGNLRKAYGHIPSGSLGNSEVRSTLNATSVNWDNNDHFQFGHVHRARAERIVLDRGLATSGGSTTLTDSGKSWSTSPKQWAGLPTGGREVFVVLLGGQGSADGNIRRVINNTATQLTVNSAWTTSNPNNTTYYEIFTYDVNCLAFLVSIVFGIHTTIQFGGFDSGSLGGAPATAGGDLSAYLGTGVGTQQALPWKLKTRIVGNVAEAAMWKASDTEPAYGTVNKSGAWVVPVGYGNYPGLSGLYAGHLLSSSSDWLEYDDMTITVL